MEVLALCGISLSAFVGLLIIRLAVRSSKAPGHARVKSRLSGIVPPTWTDW